MGVSLRSKKKASQRRGKMENSHGRKKFPGWPCYVTSPQGKSSQQKRHVVHNIVELEVSLAMRRSRLGWNRKKRRIEVKRLANRKEDRHCYTYEW